MSKIHKINKGQSWELEASKYYHQKYTPVLISASFFRNLGAGQVDLCVINEELNCLHLIECKNGGIISNKQRSRLKQSAKLLSHLFEKSITLKICQKKSN